MYILADISNVERLGKSALRLRRSKLLNFLEKAIINIIVNVLIVIKGKLLLNVIRDIII